MKKYIIIDTWNGEGYTDSNAQIMEFENHSEAPLHCNTLAVNNAKELNGLVGVSGNSFEYEDGNKENQGAFSFVPYNENIIGVVLNPMINDYEIVTNVDRWEELINEANNNGDSEDVEELRDFRSGDIDKCYVHSGGESGDALFIRLRIEEVCETGTQPNNKITEVLLDRLNKSQRAIDSATDIMKENGWDDTDAYLELVGELSDNEEVLTSLETLNDVKTDFVVQEMSLMGGIVSELRQGLKDCRQAMVDGGMKEDSIQIISIDNLLNK